MIYSEINGVITTWEYDNNGDIYTKISDNTGYREIKTNSNGVRIYYNRVSYC